MGTSSAYKADRLYTGKAQDSDTTQLTYFHARYYDSYGQMFRSHDPADPDLNNPLSLNPYLFVLNNPFRFVDPDGRKERLPEFLRILEYGNWGGPGWSGGNKIPQLPAVDSLDFCYKEHDGQYLRAAKLSLLQIEFSADQKLIKDLKNLAYDTKKWDVPPKNPLVANLHKFSAIQYFEFKLEMNSAKSIGSLLLQSVDETIPYLRGDNINVQN